MKTFLSKPWDKDNLKGGVGDIDADKISDRYGLDKEEVKLIRNGRHLMLPPNMLIRATMNTSDQSLFPIDSAFKRRWDWEYVSITDGGKGWKIVANGKKFDWWEFLKKVNGIVYSETSSFDKQLGYFFLKLKDGETDISAKKFVGKVVFYLWNDVFKDCELKDDALKLKKADGTNDRDLMFTDFFKESSEVVDEKVIDGFLTGLLKDVPGAIETVSSSGSGAGSVKSGASDAPTVASEQTEMNN